MTAGEQGFLLLTSHLGNPQRKVLSASQLRILAGRMRSMEKPEMDRELTARDLVALGYGQEMACRIVSLLEEHGAMEHYCKRARHQGCFPITRVSPGYPRILRQRLGLDSPGCLWIKGDPTILNTSAVSLVGSRDLQEENRIFAEAAGRQAALQGLTLVSGNARGADRTAQDACLEAGGRVISIVADELCRHPERRNLLYVSEDGFDEPFSAQRALSRNRCIHALGHMVLVAQATQGKGGTWDGTVKNLRFGWSSVACFRDGTEASIQLEQMGAYLIGLEDLNELYSLSETELSFL